MLAGRLALTRSGQTVGEFLAIVGQQASDLERASLVKRLQESRGGPGRLVGLDCHEHSALSALACERKLYTATANRSSQVGHGKGCN